MLSGELAGPDPEEEKIELCRRVLKLDPNEEEALRRIALILIARGQLVEARPYVLLASELAPNDPSVAQTHADYLFESGDYRTALTLYKRVLRRGFSPDKKHLWQQIAGCHYFLGNHRRAKRAAIKLREVCIEDRLRPDDPGVVAVFEKLGVSSQATVKVMSNGKCG
jgi:pentatricopeptide repeat protein